jgi:hypothetical protein
VEEPDRVALELLARDGAYAGLWAYHSAEAERLRV